MTVKVPCLGCESDRQPSAPGLCTVNAFMSACLLFAIDPKQVAVYLASFCPEHGAIAARAMVVLAQKNGMNTQGLGILLERAFGLPRAFTCPKCGKTSHNPNDLLHGFCGACHEYTAPPGASA